MGRIQTGVDRLVALVKEKQKISVDEAAKTLGVSKTIVGEWADFLEEEGIVEVKYSLAKTYLIDHKLTKTESVQKERQLEAQRETFVTKVDSAATSLEHEAVGFEQFRKEFDHLKTDLGASLKAVQGELVLLKRYEGKKHTVTRDVHKERDRLAREERAADAAISKEYARYHDLLHDISAQEKRLLAEKKRVHDVILSEHTVGKKIAAYEALLAGLRRRAMASGRTAAQGTKVLRTLAQSTRALRQELAAIERSRLRPLLVLRAQHQEKLKKLERLIMAKALSERKHAKHPAGGTVAARRKLEEFFRRKKSIEHLLDAIEHDKRELLSELEQLERRAEAYRVGKNASKLDELRKKLKELDAGKERLHEHVQRFLKTLR